MFKVILLPEKSLFDSFSLFFTCGEIRAHEWCICRSLLHFPEESKYLHQTRRVFTPTLHMIRIICNNSNNEFEEKKRWLVFDMQSLLQNENIGSKWRIWRLEISKNKSITYLRWIVVCDVEFKHKTSTNTRIPTWLNCTSVFFSVSFLPASPLLNSNYAV